MTERCERRDLVRSRVATGMCILSAALIAAQFVWPAQGAWFAVTLLLAWTVFCAVNAWRCSRLHCYFTAPIFLAAAIATLLAHYEIWEVPAGWIWLFIGVGVFLSCGAEEFLGKYRRKATSGS